uniref:Serine palmitoyltransferase small subunit B n=1 Tax=Crocodylus porosus TaxID=8502 RepID=A0A7M4ELJ5_CROPO
MAGQMKMKIKSTWEYFYWLYWQYQLITCGYLLDPWEKIILHSFTISVLVMMSYTAYTYALHICLILKFFLYLPGNEPESDVYIMK